MIQYCMNIFVLHLVNIRLKVKKLVQLYQFMIS